MQDDSLLLHDLDNEGVLRLTLNDRARRNALSEAMIEQLADALDDAAGSVAVRVIVLAAKGPAFCAGHDLKELTAARSAPDQGRAVFTRIMSRCAQLMQAIVANPKPVIAEVGGVATAAGCQLVASCDLAIASDTARFCTPGVSIGLFCSTPMVALSRTVSNKHAMEMLLTGDLISATRAAEIGLVNRAVEPDQLTGTTLAMAHQIAARSQMTLATGKQAFYAQNEMSRADAYAYASRIMVDNLLAQDAEEGIGAFLEKRAPAWQDA